MAFKNEFTLTGRISFGKMVTTKNDNKIFNCQLSNGSKEKGYNNFKLRAFKENAVNLADAPDGTVITAKGWLTQDKWEDEKGNKRSIVILNLKSFEPYEDKEDNVVADDLEIPF